MRAGYVPAFRKCWTWTEKRGQRLEVIAEGSQEWRWLGLLGLSWLSFDEKPMILASLRYVNGIIQALQAVDFSTSNSALLNPPSNYRQSPLS